MGTGKASELLDYNFLISILEKPGFGKSFFWEIRSRVLLTVVQLQSVSYVGEKPVKMT